jgi:uroporphyrin-III C-methyltransferase/precorrin-2 dehydrogenase/sirohydrochlorin ferrochelatase
MRTFPIFIAVDRNPPLVVGGGELAAVKARLLLKRADVVDVAADAVCAELAALEAAGKIGRLPASPGIDAVRGRPLVICATEDDAEDARVSAIARALGVPVNVPDRPELCSFALGAMVDRGEVTIAIGTEGAAPVLAQRLRAWLETEIHPRIGALASIAREFRDALAEKLPPGTARRAFWDRVFDGDIARAAYSGDDALARRLLGEAVEDAGRAGPPQGRVLLVGAGPGDPDLLTLKAVRALKTADVVLYDRLIGAGVLDHARREAELIPVGKCKGAPSTPQSEINRLIVAHGSAGKVVVRLKGGDPFVFGRAAEEIDAARGAGLAVEVIPGVTAAIAASASIQIPMTHRELSHSVTVLSGHAAGDGETDVSHLDFRALKPTGNTLAIYMGVSKSGVLASALLDAGWPSSTPVMAVERATQPGERRVRATLSTLAFAPETLRLKGPAVLIVGAIAGLDAHGAVEEPDLSPILERACA